MASTLEFFAVTAGVCPELRAWISQSGISSPSRFLELDLPSIFKRLDLPEEALGDASRLKEGIISKQASIAAQNSRASLSNPKHLYLLCPIIAHRLSSKMEKIAAEKGWTCLADVALNPSILEGAGLRIAKESFSILLSKGGAALGKLPFLWEQSSKTEEDQLQLLLHAGRSEILKDIPHRVQGSPVIEELLEWAASSRALHPRDLVELFGFHGAGKTRNDLAKTSKQDVQAIRADENSVVTFLKSRQLLLPELDRAIEIANASDSLEDFAARLKENGITRKSNLNEAGVSNLLFHLSSEPFSLSSRKTIALKGYQKWKDETRKHGGYCQIVDSKPSEIRETLKMWIQKGGYALVRSDRVEIHTPDKAHWLQVLKKILSGGEALDYCYFHQACSKAGCLTPSPEFLDGYASSTSGCFFRFDSEVIFRAFDIDPSDVLDETEAFICQYIASKPEGYVSNEELTFQLQRLELSPSRIASYLNIPILGTRGRQAIRYLYTNVPNFDDIKKFRELNPVRRHSADHYFMDTHLWGSKFAALLRADIKDRVAIPDRLRGILSAAEFTIDPPFQVGVIKSNGEYLSGILKFLHALDGDSYTRIRLIFDLQQKTFQLETGFSELTLADLPEFADAAS